MIIAARTLRPTDLLILDEECRRITHIHHAVNFPQLTVEHCEDSWWTETVNGTEMKSFRYRDRQMASFYYCSRVHVLRESLNVEEIQKDLRAIEREMNDGRC